MHPELQNLPHGWFHHGQHILSLVKTHQPRVVVELGTWRGASAIAIARCVRAWRGVVYCVDTWQGNVDGNGHERPDMIAECAWNQIRAGIAGSIRLIPASTLDAAAWWSGPIDFLYIDANHSYQAVKDDLRAWVPHVAEGGLIAGDDYGNSIYPGTTRAWDEFEASSGLRFHRIPNLGMALIIGRK